MVPLHAPVLPALGLLSLSVRQRLLALHGNAELTGPLAEELGAQGQRLLERMVASGVWTGPEAQREAPWVWRAIRVWAAGRALSWVGR